MDFELIARIEHEVCVDWQALWRVDSVRISRGLHYRCHMIARSGELLTNYFDDDDEIIRVEILVACV